MSSCTTSATRRSRSVVRAVFTAVAAAASHDSVLVPISSVTRYTLMTFPSVLVAELRHSDEGFAPAHVWVRRSGCGDRGRASPPIVAVSASQHKQRLDAGRRRGAPLRVRRPVPGSPTRDPSCAVPWWVSLRSVANGRSGGCAGGVRGGDRQGRGRDRAYGGTADLRVQADRSDSPHPRAAGRACRCRAVRRGAGGTGRAYRCAPCGGYCAERDITIAQVAALAPVFDRPTTTSQPPVDPEASRLAGVHGVPPGGLAELVGCND